MGDDRVNWLRTSVLRQLLLLFFCILLPLSVISLMSLSHINLQLREEILESARTSANDLASRLDNQLANSQELAGTVNMQVRTNRLSNPKYSYDLYEWVSDVNFVRDLLTNIKQSNPLLSNVRIYLPLNHLILNANGYPNGSVQRMSETKYEELRELQSQTGGVMRLNGAAVLLHYASLTNSVSISEIEISPKELFNYLHNNAGNGTAEFSLYLMSDESFLRDPTRSELSDSIEANALSVEGGSFIETEDCFLFASRLSYSGLMLYQAIPTDALFRSQDTSTVFYTLFLVMIFVCVIVFFAGAYRLIHRPMHQLITAFDEIERGNFAVRVHSSEAKDFGYLYDGFNRMAGNLGALILQDYQQKLLLQKAELKQLQAQINPHFLYNSFFMLHRMINMDMQEESKEVAKLLGGYFQYITNTNADTVPLSDEYDHAVIYANIQRKRFEGRIDVEIEPLPEDYRNMMVPKLILQPLLENAYNYGMDSKLNGGYLRMWFMQTPERLSVTIEDNGADLTDEKLAAIQQSFAIYEQGAAEVTGLINILRRLQIYYEREDVMTVKRSELGGFSVTIHIYRDKGE